MLIVEDDPEMGMGLVDFFELRGFAVTLATDGDEGLRYFTSVPPFDIVLMDMMLPRKDGFEVLRTGRDQGVKSPVVLLTAKAREADKLQGFDLGADDYVTKPFSAEELIARVRAVLNRTRQEPNFAMDIAQFGEIQINFSDHTAVREGRPLRFTALEFDILQYFIQHKGRTVSRKQLLRDVWKISPDITTRTIDRHIASIRKKIEPDPDIPRHIETVYGIGYKFID